MTNTPEPIDAKALLPCPFCGGEAQRLTIGDDEPNNAGGDVITCTRCGASSHVEFGRKENLVSRWNTRVSDTREGEAVDAKVLTDELLAKSAWATMGEALHRQMPQRLREQIGSKAVAEAHWIASLETINTSRVARGEPPLTMSQFLAGDVE